MPAIKSNKLIPFLAVIALLVVGFIALKASRDPDPLPTESPLEAVHAQPSPAGEAESSQGGGGLLGGVKGNNNTRQAADADTPTESLKTLTAEVAAARAEMQRLADENRQLRSQGMQTDQARRQIKDELRDELRSELRTEPTAPLAAPESVPATPSSATPLDPSNLMSQLPQGFGFDALRGAGFSGANTPAMDDSSMGMAAPGGYRTVLPLGVRVGKGVDGRDALLRTTAGVEDRNRSAMAPTASQSPNALAPFDGADGGARSGKKKEPKRYFTIPENATLLGATAMSAIIGRIPVDGKVNDPMQFKLIIGPENLAASGQYLPRDLSGIIMSGIAIGDLNLQCSEGLIHSMTFVFNDGTIQTVSQRNGGAMTTGMGDGGSSSKGLVQTSKLGYISDRHGNPCIAGKFITNAPAYLTDTIGLKMLSLAGEAAAMAQTTVSSSTGYGGSSTTSSVTGDQNRFILGKAASGATNEVTNWLSKRMGDSFDAILTLAGAEIVVNIDQEIPIDKKPDARRLDYGRIDADNRSSKGRHHDFD
jgi:integrating conjugative element protein (TIGR03752 family)